MMVQSLFNEFWNQKFLFIFIFISPKIRLYVSFDISMSKGTTREPTPQSQKMLKIINSYRNSVFTTTLQTNADCPELCGTHHEVTTRDERAHIIFFPGQT